MGLFNRHKLTFYYLGGHPKMKKARLLDVQDKGDYLLIGQVELPKEDVVEIKLVPRSAIGNALGGAVLGALLLGPLGALAGGAIAGAAGSQAIQLTYRDGDLTYDLFFTDADAINKCTRLKQMIASQPTS